jgi:hypothetical protein
VTCADLLAAIKKVPRCDELHVTVGGELYRFDAARVKRAVSAVKHRKGLELHADKCGLEFNWSTGTGTRGGLLLYPDAPISTRKKVNGRYVWTTKPRTQPPRAPASVVWA